MCMRYSFRIWPHRSEYHYSKSIIPTSLWIYQVEATLHPRPMFRAVSSTTDIFLHRRKFRWSRPDRTPRPASRRILRSSARLSVTNQSITVTCYSVVPIYNSGDTRMLWRAMHPAIHKRMFYRTTLAWYIRYSRLWTHIKLMTSEVCKNIIFWQCRSYRSMQWVTY